MTRTPLLQRKIQTKQAAMIAALGEANAVFVVARWFLMCGSAMNYFIESKTLRKRYLGCLGALDGTYVKVRVPESEQKPYRTRKGEICTNVLSVCTRDLQFIYVLAGWEGSEADSRVLRDAISRPNGLKVTYGNYYLCDAGYINGKGFLTPYRSQRYHLSDWSHPPMTSKEFYNKRHSSARNCIEICFGLIKAR
ncbi:ALP1-like protein [Tanacetum coccineum]